MTNTTDDDAPEHKIEDAISLLANAGYEIHLNGMKVELRGNNSWTWAKA